MKKLITIFLVVTSLVMGVTQSDIISQIASTVPTDINTSTTIAEIKADNQAAKVVEEIGKNNVIVNDYKNSVTQNEFQGKGAVIQSIYQSYFSQILNKGKNEKVFGMDIINNANSSGVSTSIDKDYMLGTGDLISLKIWSDLYSADSQDAAQVLPIEINKQGTIFVPNIGSFFANGKSINNLQKEILAEGKKKLKYFNAEITLEKIREINVFVVGEVNKPGQITTTPYSNVLNVLNTAGGVKGNASIRNIKIIRTGQEITIDLYPYFLANKDLNELKLKDGDTIFIPLAKELVSVEGEVARPGIYELQNEKDYTSLINLAGGYSKVGDKKLVQAYWVDGENIKIENLDIKDKIKNNLIRLNINKINDIDKNEIFILGAVVNPGDYAYSSGMDFKEILLKSGGFIRESSETFATIIRGRENKKIINFDPNKENPKLELADEIYIYNYKDIDSKAYATIQGAVNQVGDYQIYEGMRVMNLIYDARGLKESLNLFMDRADLYRIDEDGNLKVFKINLNKLLAGDENENLLLKRNDILKIYTYDEVVRNDEIFVYGEVRAPGKYRYYTNISLEDLIFYSKGLQSKADNNITIVRNDVLNKKVIELTVDIERNPDFKILQDDLIFVRKKAEWVDKKIVEIAGFVKYPGTYSINPKESMTSLIARAGGFTEEAFPEGIQFNRGTDKKKITNFEYDKNSSRYIRDIELQDGDTVYIPEKPTTVRVEGEVFAPSYIVYDKSMNNYKDYIGASGGYKESAYKSKVFVVKANGKTVDKPSKTKIEAGDTIIVPLDSREKKGFDKVMDTFKGTLEIISSVALIVLLF